MGHRKEKEHNSHHFFIDDSSDDVVVPGHSKKKKKKLPKGYVDDDSSSNSSSSSSSSRSTSFRQRDDHGGDERAQAPGGDEEVESPGEHGAEDNAPEESLEERPVPAGPEDVPAINGVEEIDHSPVFVSETPEENVLEVGGLSDRVVGEREEGMREESEDDESEVSDAPVYDKFLVETSLKEDNKVETKDGRRSPGVDEASLEKQGSGKKKYDVVSSETLEGIHDSGNCDAAESAEKIVVPEPVKPEALEESVVVADPEEEHSAKEVIEDNGVSSITDEQVPVEENREISDALVVEAEGEGLSHFASTENSAPEEVLEESVVSRFEGDSNAHAENDASEIVNSESTEESAVVAEHEEGTVKDTMGQSNFEQSFVSEEQAAALNYMVDGEQKGSSAVVVLEGEDNDHAEKSEPEKTLEEPVNVDFKANGIVLESDVASNGPANLESKISEVELEGKGGHDDRREGESESSKELQSVRGHRDLSVVLGSPLEHQRRFINQFRTPSPPKRENSVYKIVMALEGLQVGEKCIHGEIDHGTCHQRYGDRRMSPSPSFSSSARFNRETSTSPKDEDEVATPDTKGESAEVRVSDGEKREVDSSWSFVQHDSHSGITTQQTSTVKSETYTDTVVFRRDDGFLPRTPGKSPLSGSQSMRAVFSQADASGSTTPRLKIVHEFAAEKDDGEESHDNASTSTLANLSVEGESEVERILRLQETHDLVCPVCRSCITKRVILRKRKRTTVISTDKWETEVRDEEEENIQEQTHDNVGDGDTVFEQYENYGCLECFTFLFRRETRTQVVGASGAAEAAAPVSVASTPQMTDQSAVRLPEPVAVSPPALIDTDYDNRCLPIFFTWRRKTIIPTDAEIVAPLLSKEEKSVLSEESSVEISEAQSIDVPAGDLPSEIQQPTVSEVEQNTPFETQPPPASEILELPAAPGVVEGVQLPVVVVESREDRLCFPFLWRRASKTTQVQSEFLRPLLAKEDIKHQPDVVEQQSREIEKSVNVEPESKEIQQDSDELMHRSGDVEQQTEDFTRIEDDLWMRREVLLEVPVSVPPQETLTAPGPSPAPDSSDTAAESETSFKAIRVTEAERRVDCLCFPSWSSTETTSEETEALLPESSRVTTNSLQEGMLTSSETEATEHLQTSISVKGSERKESIPTSSVFEGVASSSEASEIISSSTTAKEVVSSVTSGTQGAEIVLPSPSLKGAVLPSAASTDDRETQRAGLNCMDCMDIVIPSYPWGPPGTASRKEALGRAEDHSGNATSVEVDFSTVGQVVDKAVVILPEQVVSENLTNLSSQAEKPQEIIFPIQTTTGSVQESESQPKKSEGVVVMAQVSEGRGLSEDKISTMRGEDSRCFPLLLPTISWRRQELKSGEILDQSSKTETAEIKSSGAAETKLSQEVERETDFGEIEVSRNQSQKIEQVHNDIGAEAVDEEEVPLKRKPPVSKIPTPSKVEPLLAEEGQQLVLSEETDDSNLPEVPDREIVMPTPSKVEPLLAEEGEQLVLSEETDDSNLPEVPDREITQDLMREPNLPTVLPVDETYEKETREMGTWNCCLPSRSQTASQFNISQDVTKGPSLPAVLPTNETFEEERREMGTWNCCLPSYTQLAYQPIEDRVAGEQAASSIGLLEASGSHVSDQSESVFHEEVTRETTIHARVTTQTTTTKSHTDATNHEILDAVKIDTSVSYVHASVQHDEGAVEGTIHLDDHPTFSLQPADKIPVASIQEEDHKPVTQPPLGSVYSTGYAALTRFLDDEEEEADEDAAINERLADTFQQSATSEEVEPLKAVTEVKQDNGEDLSIEKDIDGKITDSDAVTETRVPAVLSESVKQDIHREIARGDVPEAPVEMPASLQEEDESCCLPRSRWLWGRAKLTVEEAQLREPLLGRDTGSQVEPAGLLERDSEVDSKADTSAHVTLQQTHEVTHTTTDSTAGRANDDGECNCFPWGGRYTRDSTEIDTTVTVTSDDTVIEVEGFDARSTLEAAREAAQDAGILDEGLIYQEPEYIKSVVHGGLDISLTSLGVVASAAGGDAKTRNVLALGLANLIFGSIAHYSKVQNLYNESPARFKESVGPRFWINGLLSMISFLVFGALPVLTFGFSFRQLNDHDYKMAATVLVSVVVIVFLGCGKVAAKMTELSYTRTIINLVLTGILAAVAAFYTGDYISILLTKYGILDE